MRVAPTAASSPDGAMAGLPGLTAQLVRLASIAAVIVVGMGVVRGVTEMLERAAYGAAPAQMASGPSR